MDQRNEELERAIVSNTLNNSIFFNEISPFLVSDFFIDPTAKLVVKKCIDYFTKYQKPPEPSNIRIMIESDGDLTTMAKSKSLEYMKLALEIPPTDNIKFLFEQTEVMAKDNALFQALSDSYDIWTSPDKDLEKIRPLIDHALSVKFQKKISTDLFDDLEGFYDRFTSLESRIAFEYAILNLITNGGIPRETLNMLLAGTNVGKTLLLCWLAVMYVRLGYNVFYASSEINVFETRKRMFAGLYEMDLALMAHNTTLTKDAFIQKSKNFANMKGKLKIEAWPSHTASALDIERLIRDEMKINPNWKPDVVLVDHLSLFSSYNMNKSVRGVNDHKYEMAIAEELRNLGTILECAVWSAAQFNREGNKDQSGRSTNIAGSFGIAYTADFMLGLVASADAQTLHCHIEKSRYSNKAAFGSIDLGLNYDQQRIYELDKHANLNVANKRYVGNDGGQILVPDNKVIEPAKTVIQF